MDCHVRLMPGVPPKEPDQAMPHDVKLAQVHIFSGGFAFIPAEKAKKSVGSEGGPRRFFGGGLAGGLPVLGVSLLCWPESVAGGAGSLRW